MVFVTISTSTPISDQRRRSAWVSAAYWAWRIGWTLARSRTGSGRPAERTNSTGLLLREVRLAAPRVVPEDAGRDQSGGRKGEPPERPPDEVLGVGDARQRQSQRLAGTGGARRVEDGKVGVLLRRLDESAPEAGIAQQRLEVLGEQVARDVDFARAQRLGDRRRRQRGAELDAVQARPWSGAVLRVAFEDDAIRGVQSDAEGPGPDRPLRRLRPGDGDRGPPVGQERRKDRHGMLEADDDLEVRVGEDPGHVRGAAVEELLQPLDGGEGCRHHAAREADRALERRLDGRRVQGRSVGEGDARAQVEAQRRATVLERPALREVAREVALRVGRDERLEDVGQDLVLLGGVVDRGLLRGEGIRHRDEERAAAGHFFLDRG